MHALKFRKFISRASKLIIALTFCMMIAVFFAACGEESTQPPTPPTQDSGSVTPNDTPDTPDVPDTPNTPDTPDVPETPDTPNTPDEPDTPDTPDVPDTPSDRCQGGHTFGEYKVIKAATCKEAGKEERTCSVCGKTEERDIAKTDDHTFGEYKVIKAATCKEAGKEERTCSVCGKKEERDIAKTDDHAFGEYEVVKAATCKEAGKEERICYVCGKKEEREIAITDEHEFVDQKVLEEATCVEAGRKEVKCSVCGKVEEHAIPATGKHTFVDGKCECGMEEAGYLPPKELFCANVFRLEGYDLGEKLVGTCSGFVLDEKGLFVTSGDVLKNAYTAKAVFEAENGTKTTLEVGQISLQSGFVVGKIENFYKISQDFRSFPLESASAAGETVYAVGVTKDGIEVLAGETRQDAASFEGALSGESYISFGGKIDGLCFGGLLLSRDLDAIGMLCAVNQEENISYALSAQGILEATETQPTMQSLAKAFHPENAGFAELFDRVKGLDGFQKTEANGVTTYAREEATHAVNDKGVMSNDQETRSFRSDLTMEIKIVCNWENGDRLEVKFSGKWDGKGGFSDLKFECKYTWKDGQYYTVSSSSVSYDEDLSKTLPTYTSQTSSGYTITQENIEYAKDQFNYCYEVMLSYMKK